MFYYLNYVPRVVALALELHIQYGLPLREASRLLDKRFKHRVPKSTLADWSTKLAGVKLAVAQPEFSSVWHVDELFVRHEQRLPGGKRKWFDYLWVVCDDKSNVIAMHLTSDRSEKSAVQALQKAKETAGFSPRVLVSDEYVVYSNACRKVFGKQTMHVKAHFAATQFIYRGQAYSFSNNRIERLNSTLRQRLRRIRGYKGLPSGTRFFQRLTLTLTLSRSGELADALLN